MTDHTTTPEGGTTVVNSQMEPTIDENPWIVPIGGIAESYRIDLVTHQYLNNPDVSGDFTQLAMDASVRFDGCVDLRWYHATDGDGAWSADDADYIHMCDIDGMIANLTRLRDRARQHFGGDWPG